MGGLSGGGSDRSEWGEHAHQKTPAAEDERRLEAHILALLLERQHWTCKGGRGERARNEGAHFLGENSVHKS